VADADGPSGTRRGQASDWRAEGTLTQ
jgi:hypothetical protein